MSCCSDRGLGAALPAALPSDLRAVPLLQALGSEKGRSVALLAGSESAGTSLRPEQGPPEVKG